MGILHSVAKSFAGSMGGIYDYYAGLADTFAFEEPHTPSARSEEHTSELQSLMRNSYAVFCLKKKKHNIYTTDDSLIRKSPNTDDLSVLVHITAMYTEIYYN